MLHAINGGRRGRVYLKHSSGKKRRDITGEKCVVAQIPRKEVEGGRGRGE